MDTQKFSVPLVAIVAIVAIAALVMTTRAPGAQMVPVQSATPDANLAGQGFQWWWESRNSNAGSEEETVPQEPEETNPEEPEEPNQESEEVENEQEEREYAYINLASADGEFGIYERFRVGESKIYRETLVNGVIYGYDITLVEIIGNRARIIVSEMEAVILEKRVHTLPDGTIIQWNFPVVKVNNLYPPEVSLSVTMPNSRGELITQTIQAVEGQTQLVEGPAGEQYEISNVFTADNRVTLLINEGSTGPLAPGDKYKRANLEFTVDLIRSPQDDTCLRSVRAQEEVFCA